MITLELTIAGIATGCIYALAGMGLVLTYKATGVFNFAYGAIAMIVAYIFWQTRGQWHWPLVIAAPFALLIAAPAIGLALEWIVFRPLQRKRASAAEKLVATIGVFLLCLGVAYTVWTGKVRTAPQLITNRHIDLPLHLVVGVDQVVTILLTIVVGGGLAMMFRRTQLGVEIRAVVDRRELAELASVNVNRVAGISWALGCALAGLTGVLLVQGGPLNPFQLTLIVIETFSIAVVARLTSLPVAVGAGVLILGVFKAYFTSFEPTIVPLAHWHLPSWLRNDIDVIKPILSVVVLFVALVVLRRLDEPADEATAGGSMRRIEGISPTVTRVLGLVVFGVALILPFLLDNISIARGQVMLALIVVFGSIVCISGFCGYITIGQAGFAGFGAYVTGRLVRVVHMPVVPAMLLGGVGAMVIGVAAGYPALRRRGLFLGLTSLSMGLLLYEAVFSSDVFKSRGLKVPRPSVFGLSFSGDRAFYFFELFCVVVLLVLANNLRKGRLGRILAAMRDSEVAAESVGIELRRYKLFIFAVSAFIAGIGGSLLAQQTRIFSGDSFDPITSLLWFAVVVVAGVTSVWGAVVGGATFVLLDVVFHTQGVSQLVIAVGALVIGYLPGGSLLGLARRVAVAVSHPRGLQVAFAEGRASQGPLAPAADLIPSPFAERILAGQADGAR
ncbi:MAG: ABC transporter permease [Acidimicrobiales bacterium]